MLNEHAGYPKHHLGAADPKLIQGTPEWIEEVCTYHAATHEQLEGYKEINQRCKEFLTTLFKVCPSSADRSAAIRLVREARMTANSSIALNGLC